MLIDLISENLHCNEHKIRTSVKFVVLWSFIRERKLVDLDYAGKLLSVVFAAKPFGAKVLDENHARSTRWPYSRA